MTPIFRAAWGYEERHVETVKVLLDAGVSPAQKSPDGMELDDMAEHPGIREMLRKILGKPAEDLG